MINRLLNFVQFQSGFFDLNQCRLVLVPVKNIIIKITMKKIKETGEVSLAVRDLNLYEVLKSTIDAKFQSPVNSHYQLED